MLPDFVDDITLRQLTLGDGGIDVQLDRAGSQVAVHVLARRGGDPRDHAELNPAYRPGACPACMVTVGGDGFCA